MTTYTRTVYIGVDPGLVTGLACFDEFGVRHAALTQLNACEKVYEWLEDYVNAADCRVILAVERFTLGAGRAVKTAQPEALEIIGVMRWFVGQYRHIHLPVILEIQGASEASRVGSRENLVRTGWWIPSDPDQHRNKASAQVALAILKYEPARWHQLLAGKTS